MEVSISTMQNDLKKIDKKLDNWITHELNKNHSIQVSSMLLLQSFS